jgi:hypothetical protein
VIRLATHPPRPLTGPPPDAEEWRQFESANRRATDLYKTLPISLDRSARLCGCGRRTGSRYGVCRACQRGES